MKKYSIDVEHISTRLSYNPETGDFVWLVNNKGHRRAGDKAGHKNRRGYWIVKVDQVGYPAHRLAWAMYHGRDTDLEIDHIDGNPLNNRIDNLREATRAQNARNKKGSGVRFDQGRWLARVGINYKTVYLGRYETKEEAVAAVNGARRAYSGEFANTDR